MAKKRVKRSKPMYGQGLNGLLDQVAPAAQQPASSFAYGALTDADKWWANQGAKPAPVRLSMVPSTPGDHLGYGTYSSGQVELSQPYVDKVTAIANDASLSRKGRIAALAGLWGLSAHERGHNLGYGHTQSGLMAPDAAMQIPGEAYVWAASMVPKKHRVVLKTRRRK